MPRKCKPVFLSDEDIDYFLSQVEKGEPDECWPWKGLVSPWQEKDRAYGFFMGLGAHRVAWWVEHRRQPVGAVMRHSCHNPICCNPAHLSPGSHKENSADSKASGRLRGRPKGEKIVRLTDEQREYIATARRECGRLVRAVVLAKEFSIHKSTVHRLRREWRQQQQKQSETS